MKINFIGFYYQSGGYGRFTSRLIKGLQDLGVEVVSLTVDDLYRPDWMLRQKGVDFNNLTITCNEPRKIKRVPGRHWLFTMCEGEVMSKGKIRDLNKCGIERMLVPCEFVKNVFQNSGFRQPISVIPGGTDPQEFPKIQKFEDRPYTFLTIADRGNRKGWEEAFYAFYKAFGGRTTGNQDVRLIIKTVPFGNPLVQLIMKKGDDLDPRISYDTKDYHNISDLYWKADCVVLPSRSEGWGMPHREAAMMGLPVITQQYAGLDDGHTREWAMVCEGGELREIPKYGRAGGSGRWMIANVNRLAEDMLWCYENQVAAKQFGLEARDWLIDNQTWTHSASKLIQLIEKAVYGGIRVGQSTHKDTSEVSQRLHPESSYVR